MQTYTDTTQDPLSLLEFSGTRHVPLVMQTEVAECGLACLLMVASFHGHKQDLSSLRQSFNASLSGMNLQQMIALADKIGLSSRALKCPIEEVGKLALPCVLHWDMNHFVVLTGVTKRYICINDPAQGKRKMTLQEFSLHYTGIALELAPSAEFKKQDLRVRMKLSQLWSRITGLKQGLLALLVLSVILQLFSLVAPYYMQWVVDEVLLSRDQPLLFVLAVGFGLLVILNVVTTGIRSYLVLRLSSMMNIQMGVNLIRHLFKLPMSYFEKRHIGDLVSRFGSLAQIRERLTTGLTETLVDGIMSLAVLVMMLFYSVKLTLVVIVAILLYTLLRLALYQPLRRTTEETIQSQAKEQTNFLENIRGIQTIKLFTSESLRQSLWQNHYAEVINSEIRLGKLKISFDVVNKLLFGLENVIVIYLAAMAVMAGSLTVGMILAFIAYKNQLTERMTNFIEQVILFRMLRLHLERISDIAMSDIEANRDAKFQLPEAKGELELKNVSFRYADNEAWIIKDLNLKVTSGESLAIIGASGCGKSTLVKIMLGLLKPTEGKVLLDGIEVSKVGLIQYRKQIAAVMQNDTLLSGSVLDNLCFFDPEPNLLKVQQCAHLAAIDEDINRMPMGYNSLVGDMGNQFSGGQVQRLLLARALYKSPKLLFMDEATSHLDVMNEIRIGEQIKQLAMTRIIVAHRPETIKQADRVLVMHMGQLHTPESLQQQGA
ncbi:peptidase domain-containing ABC transporter [Shewanella algae]|uniref:peptidase domain-containing ABC transporter n=1 Tax=Shewanella algae TaxID=38313 RepID=UPI001AAFBCF5|nr:peptidase domain-containing ABC transporter [Shewanella algae]MBO2581833.1 peptidase domain-containing ABC transporter [Shewanella algae]